MKVLKGLREACKKKFHQVSSISDFRVPEVWPYQVPLLTVLSVSLPVCLCASLSLLPVLPACLLLCLSVRRLFFLFLCFSLSLFVLSVFLFLTPYFFPYLFPLFVSLFFPLIFSLICPFVGSVRLSVRLHWAGGLALVVPGVVFERRELVASHSCYRHHRQTDRPSQKGINKGKNKGQT